MEGLWEEPITHIFQIALNMIIRGSKQEDKEGQAK
jgi:hypothetical protein